MDTFVTFLGLSLSVIIIMALLQLFGIKSRLQRLIDLQERAEQRDIEAHTPVDNSAQRS